MARIARVVIPGKAHLVIQRGAENRQVFFSADDFKEYIRLVKESCERWNVTVHAYCLMPNHVHLVVEPSTESGLARALGESHRRYAKQVNERYGRDGRLWHARFSSCVLEGAWVPRAIRYVERDPVDSGMLPDVGDYPWCSASARLKGEDDPLIGRQTVPGAVSDWASYVKTENSAEDVKVLLAHERTGRPLGSKEWVMAIEDNTGRRLRPRKRGRKPKNATPEQLAE
jgi:putative transposase